MMDKWANDMTDTQNKIDLLCSSLREIEESVLRLGEKKFRAKQVWDFLWKGYDICEMSNLPSAFRARLSEEAFVCRPAIAGKAVSKIDGTVKYLLRLSDGELIECVVMEYEHGTSICISTQAGCRMGCRFCASTIGGKKRDLTASEMLSEILTAQRDTGKRISNIVMMGIGEPLDNYGNVIRFLSIVGAPDTLNIGYRHISLSTCGIVPRIYDLANESFPITLSISLHASNNDARSEIMPINKKYPLEELLHACRDYFDKTGRRISFEYTLISNKNDSPEDADALAALLFRYFRGVPFHVNLIPVNPVRERGFVSGGAARVNAFRDRLTEKHVNATVRRHLGGDIDASCGQLRNKHTDDEETEG